MNAFRPPVRIIFGASDPYLNAGVAKRFHELFPTSELFLLPGAYHYVQIDEPEEVARLLLSSSGRSGMSGERSQPVPPLFCIQRLSSFRAFDESCDDYSSPVLSSHRSCHARSVQLASVASGMCLGYSTWSMGSFLGRRFKLACCRLRLVLLRCPCLV